MSRFNLGILLGTALSLIIFFYIGMGFSQSLQISETARTLAISVEDLFIHGFSNQVQQDLANLRGSVGIRSILRTLPVATLYLMGGVNEFTSLLLPIGSTLANVLLVSFLAKRLYGKEAGQIAGILWIVMPVTLFTASSLQYTQTSIALFLGVLSIFLKDRGKTMEWFWPFGIFLLGSTLFLFDGVIGLCLILLLVVLYLVRNNRPDLIWAPLVVFATALLFSSNWNIGKAFVVFYDGLVQLPEMEVLLPVIIFAIAVTLKEADSRDHVPLGIMGVCFLGLLWQFSFPPAVSLLFDPLFSLILVAGILMLSNIFSQTLRESETDKILLFLYATTLGVAWAAINGQKMLIPSYLGDDWFSAHAIIPALEILPGPVLLLLITHYIALNRSKEKLASKLAVALIFLLALAMIPFTWQRMRDHRPASFAANQAMDMLIESDMELPIYVVADPRLTKQLEYIGLGKAHPSINDIGSEQAFEIENGYVLYWEDEIQNPPTIWWQMDKFGALGQPRLVVARSLNQTEADMAFENASIAVQKSKSENTFRMLIGAAINANRLCDALFAWIESQTTGIRTENYFPLYGFSAGNCLDLARGENLLEEQPIIFYPGFSRTEYLAKEHALQEGAAFGLQYPFFEDPRTFYLQPFLKPNTLYLYHVEIQGPEEMMPLYWNIGEYENYLDYGLYRDWTPLTILFSTVGWDEDPLTVTLSPFLYYVHYYGGFTDVKNFQLYEIHGEMIKE